MRHKKTMLLPFLISGFGMAIQAQQSINGSGGDAYGNGGSVNYSVGQTVYSTNSGPAASVSEGVQQPYEISVVSSVHDLTNDINLSLFPNPTTNQVTLRIGEHESKNLQYQLIDSNGKVIMNNSLENRETFLSLSELAPAYYFLQVMSKGQLLKTFKILKH